MDDRTKSSPEQSSCLLFSTATNDLDPATDSQGAVAHIKDGWWTMNRLWGQLKLVWQILRLLLVSVKHHSLLWSVLVRSPLLLVSLRLLKPLSPRLGFCFVSTQRNIPTFCQLSLLNYETKVIGFGLYGKGTLDWMCFKSIRNFYVSTYRNCKLDNSLIIHVVRTIFQCI